MLPLKKKKQSVPHDSDTKKLSRYVLNVPFIFYVVCVFTVGRMEVANK